MRTARFLAIVLTLIAILGALVWVFRLPLAGWAVRTAMTSAGLEAPAAQVTALSLNGVRLENVAAGPAEARGFSFDAVEADFHWRRLWRERKVNSLRAGPGVVRILIDETGRVSVPGLPAGGGGGGDLALPFDRFSLTGAELFVDAPEGAARGEIIADYDVKSGGGASLSLLSDRLLWGDVVLDDLKSAAEFVLAADGGLSFNVSLDGDMAAPALAARDVSLTASGEGASWRDIVAGEEDALSGAGKLAFSAAEIELLDADLLALVGAAQMQTIFGEKLERAALGGAFDIFFDPDGLRLELDGADAPLALTTPDGASLTFTPQGNAPFYARGGGRETSSFRFALASDGANAKGGADIEREDDAWRIAAPVEIAEFQSEALSLDGSRIEIDARSTGVEVVADLGLKSGLKKASIGRLTITDAPFNGAFRINADLNAQRASVVSKSDCFNIGRGRGRIVEQDLDIRLSEITLCNTEGPLVVYTWTGQTACTVSGEIAARDGSIKLGQTVAKGRPPVVRFDAAYHPALNRTTITGGVANGAMAVNDAIDMSGVIGDFEFELDAAGMRANASLDHLKIAQHQGPDKKLVIIAPVTASGTAALEGEGAEFSYSLATPEGYRLGAGTGVHDMKSARGETVLRVENLTFTPSGLQPNQVSPALKGIVNDADGKMDGTIRLAWGRSDLVSEATLDFKEISFAGPTQAVTQTKGVSGTVQLTDLFPVTTNGFQTITVEGVDMDALQLGNGVVTFEFPGDESLTISKAEFPWFGGALGVYDATAGFTGEATIPLRATGADLKQIFEYVAIEGLSGSGVISGDLPVIFEGGKARIQNGVFKSDTPGVIRYKGKASEAASQAGQDAKVAFDILRDLQFDALQVTVNGALDGRLEFQMKFEGTGDVTLNNATGRVPVDYRINLDAALLELLRQANLSRDIQLQIEKGLSDGQ